VVPVVTPDEMRRIDASAPEPVTELIARAGSAVARSAVAMLGGTYGRTVDVICGPGNNGADGRHAADLLQRRGVRVRVHEADACPPVITGSDLVIDAAYGTGFHGVWTPPDVGDTPVLAVDIPSGVDALTGAANGPVLPATRTITFAALKPGQLMAPGSDLCGRLEVADIGLDTSGAHAHLVQGSDVTEWLPVRTADAHKWRAAVRVVAGSASMPGAPALVCSAAMRAGAGMVHLSVPGHVIPTAPIEVVQRPLPAIGWTTALLESCDRFHALAIGPGMGREDATAASIREAVLRAPIPVVVDADGLFALAWNAQGAAALLRQRQGVTVLTPHEGEYTLLAGGPPGHDRLIAARRLASDTGAVVLLKGPTTVIADPDGEALVVTAGDERLATAGTGDVLTGIVAAFLAAGVPALQAAAAAAWVHGKAARRGPRLGCVAGDLPALVPTVLESLL
jgi:NAD(P)H-hydrate epimerase